MDSARSQNVLLAAGACAVGAVVGAVVATRRADKQHWNKEPKICKNILDHVGNTPLVRLNRVGKSAADGGLECEILAKCEFFNAGGSVKDRIGKRMVMDAHNSGRITPGDTLIEPTSGNTGIGLALSAAVMGYKMVITMPKKMSNEKVDVLKALGAIVKRTPNNAPCPKEKAGYPYSHIAKANRILDDINATSKGPGDAAHILDQYSNPSNPLAHIEGTAVELLKQCDNKIDMIVATAGTGGTLAGIATRIKKTLPNCIIVGVDPHGSDLAVEGQGKIRNASKTFKIGGNGDSNASVPPVGGYHIEGIGYDFIPEVLGGIKGVHEGARVNLVDYWYKTSDPESFVMSRRLIREEGLLCGGSCGSAVVGALAAAKELGMKKGDRVVVLLADSTRNYMTKFLNDGWMEDNGFADPCYRADADIAALKSRCGQLTTLASETTWQEQMAVEPQLARAAEKQA